MKKLFFLLCVSCLFSQTDAQNLKYFRLDTVSRHLNIRPFTPGHDLMDNPDLFLPRKNFQDNQPDLTTSGNVCKKQPDGMPVLRPYGNFHMRIYQPDSSVRYSLLIKRLPMNSFSRPKR